MNEWKFEKVLSEEFSVKRPSDDFRKRLSQQSMQSLKRGYCTRLWLRRGCLLCSLLVLVAVSFLSGRRSIKHRDRVSQESLGDNSTQLVRDLIPWLRAGRLFTQVGLDDRANRAYEMASQLSEEFEAQNYVVLHHGKNQDLSVAVHTRMKSTRETRVQSSRLPDKVRSRPEDLWKPLIGTVY